MSKITDYQDYNSTAYQCKHLHTEAHENGTIIRGYVDTKNGIVGVYAERFKSSVNGRVWEYTGLNFIENGTNYTRVWQSQWQPRTISRLAREFANDVVEGIA